MTSVELTPLPRDDDGRTLWLARVGNSVQFRVESYILEPDGDGGTQVNLVVAADRVTVGDPHTRTSEPDRRNRPPMGTWGAPGVPDPREQISGWTPPPATTDAHRGGEHRVTYTVPARILAFFGVRRFA